MTMSFVKFLASITMKKEGECTQPASFLSLHLVTEADILHAMKRPPLHFHMIFSLFLHTLLYLQFGHFHHLLKWAERLINNFPVASRQILLAQTKQVQIFFQAMTINLASC